MACISASQSHSFRCKSVKLSQLFHHQSYLNFFFFRIKEACILLNILVGSAMLLQEALSNYNDKAASAEILADVGVHKMSPELALKVIATRTDIIYV